MIPTINSKCGLSFTRSWGKSLYKRTSKWLFQKITNLFLVAFHAMMATFIAAAIQAAFIPIAADLGFSLTRASYLTSLQIAILGWTPSFWKPLSNRFGCRPIFLISLICSLV